MANTAELNTRTVQGRRKLHFSSLDQMLADAQRVAESDRAGTLKILGNWSAGQTLGHMAAWMGYGLDGYPMQVPWFVKLIGRMIKNKVLQSPMPPGRRIPRVPGGTYALENMSTDVGLAHLEQTVDRFKQSPPTGINPVFGRLTPEQWTQLNLRHAELHLSFLVPGKK